MDRTGLVAIADFGGLRLAEHPQSPDGQTIDHDPPPQKPANITLHDFFHFFRAPVTFDFFFLRANSGMKFRLKSETLHTVKVRSTVVQLYITSFQDHDQRCGSRS
jgi:hypothetical protein